MDISTHTLTWSVTQSKFYDSKVTYISTHTLTWSVTYGTPHYTLPFFISTHTLTWSVTAFSVPFPYMPLISTHTLTWSVTTRFTALPLYYINFNSHAHVERDIQTKTENLELKISTHTLTWSVTQEELFSPSSREFQLTRSRGAWHWKGWKNGFKNNFNSHAHVERDTDFDSGSCSYGYFNSHAHVERDRVRK